MAKKKTPKTSANNTKLRQESDSTYFLKLVLYLILGSLWLKVSNNQSYQIPIPIGLLIGLIFTSHEHFQIDRKIEYAVLLLAMLVGFWLPYGIFISLPN